MPVLSVIVPIYNTASFLDDCISSIISQSFNDMEIICINDGSTDNSLDILEKWQMCDNRIKIYSQKNKGLSGARNTGLLHANGLFVSFVDSDDKLHPEMYKALLDKMEEYSLDVIGCSYKTYPRIYHKKFESKTGEVINFEELLSSNKRIQSSNDFCFCWRYVIKKDILDNNNISFNEDVKIGEDMIFITEVLSKCDKILLTNEPYYYYRTDNNSSLMNSRIYNHNKASSYNLMYLIKKNQIERMGIDYYSPFSEDLAKYAISIYLPFLVQNEYRNPNISERNRKIKKLLSLEMFDDAFNIVGYKNIFPTWKGYLFYLIQKFKMMPLVLWAYNRYYGR